MTKETQKNIVKILVGVAVLVGVLYLQKIFVDNGFLQELAAEGGYVGVVLFTFTNTFNYFVPIVTPTLVPTWIGAGLNPYVTVLLITGVISVTDIGFYLVGRYSHRLTKRYQQYPVIRRIRVLRKKNIIFPLFALFLWLVFVPLPNELMTVTIGFLGYRFLPVVSIVLVGNMIFNSYIAYQSLVIVGG